MILCVMSLNIWYRVERYIMIKKFYYILNKKRNKNDIILFL